MSRETLMGGTEDDDQMNDERINHTRKERRDAAENRQRILDAAVRLFDKHGVEQVSMNQIATESGIGPGTLYRRYRNKGDLCLDLIKENVVLVFEQIETYLVENQDKPASERLSGMLSLYIRFRENKAQLLKGVEDSETSSRRKPQTRSPLYDELHQFLVGLFDEIYPEKKAYPDNVFRADMLLEGLRSEPYLFQRKVRGYSPQEILEQLCSIFIK